MTSAAEIESEFMESSESLLHESEAVLHELVIPAWGGVGGIHGYPRMLYGVVMNTMSLADRLSSYSTGTVGATGQTRRMRSLFEAAGGTPESAAVLVQLWRHTLMHTGLPMEVRDLDTGVNYRWLLHWGPEHLPPDMHLTITQAGLGERILNVGALYLIDDLRRQAEAFFASVLGWADAEAGLVLTHGAMIKAQRRRLAISAP